MATVRCPTLYVAAWLAACAPGVLVAPSPLCAHGSAPPGHTDADMQQMADTLSARLARAAGTADDWVLLGRTQATLQNWQPAKAALARAIALAPDIAALHAQLGEILTLAAGGTVTQDARAEFAKAPDDPRSRFYDAVAMAQTGDRTRAVAALKTLAADTPAEAPWRGMVQNEITALENDTGLDSATRAGVTDFLARLDQPAPSRVGTGEDLPAAITAQDPAMLERHVADDPKNPLAWLALSRAYQARGDSLQARAALRRANTALPGRMDLLLAYGSLLANDVTPDQPAPALAAVMRQVQALDPAQPDALWYLGLDAANRGDVRRARAYWLVLLDRLPKGSGDATLIRSRLDLLAHDAPARR